MMMTFAPGGGWRRMAPGGVRLTAKHTKTLAAANPWLALNFGTAHVLLWCVIAGLVKPQFINFENGLVVPVAIYLLETLAVLAVILFVALFSISGRTGRSWVIVHAACVTAFLWSSVEFLRDEGGQTLHFFWPPDFRPGARTLQRQTSPLLDTAPYILPCAQRLLNRSGSVAVRSAAARRLLGVDAIFVVHYPRLKERRAMIETLLEREGLNADVNWVTFEEVLSGDMFNLKENGSLFVHRSQTKVN
jgi:hypothetical protein